MKLRHILLAAVLLAPLAAVGADERERSLALKQLSVDLSFLTQHTDLQRMIVETLGEPTTIAKRYGPISEDEIVTLTYGKDLEIQLVAGIWRRTIVNQTDRFPLALDIRIGATRADVATVLGLDDERARGNPIVLTAETPDGDWAVDVSLHFDDSDRLTDVSWNPMRTSEGC